MNRCPFCNKIGVSIWRKSWLGPATSINCKECRGKVGVSYSAIFAVIPFIIATSVATFIGATGLEKLGI